MAFRYNLSRVYLCLSNIITAVDCSTENLFRTTIKTLRNFVANTCIEVVLFLINKISPSFSVKLVVFNMFSFDTRNALFVGILVSIGTSFLDSNLETT